MTFVTPDTRPVPAARALRGITLALALVLPTTAFGQSGSGAPPRLITPPPPPTLVVTDGNFQKTLAITALDVEARIVGHLAETTMTMTFHNASRRVLAGDLTFPLPAGATVSGYGLDVHGVIVDGVVVEKQEARRIFEAEVRKGVDPGLVEKVEGAAYRTRVFPIPAGGARTVRVAWVSEVDVRPDGARYHLPLGFTDTIDDVHLRVDVVRATETPRIEGEGVDGFGFESWEDRQVAETTLRKVLLDTPVSIVLPDLPNRPVAVERAPDGTTYFAIHHAEKAPATTARIAPKRVGILWDASLSRKDADVDAEIALIQAWVKTLKGKVAAEVVVFADRPLAPVSFTLPADGAELARHLGGVVYDGGTAIGSIDEAAQSLSADMYLLFSDGVANLGETTPPTLPAPVYALNGSAVANHDGLRALALASGGAWIDLTTTTEADAVSALGRAPFAFRGARGDSLGEAYPRIAEPVDGAFSFAGVLKGQSTQLTLRFAGPGSEPVERTFSIDASDATEGTLLRRFWAQKKVNDLAVGGKRNAKAIAAVGTAHGIVTMGTSLLVLERLDQYVEYSVRPPAQLKQMRADWDRQMAQQAKATKAVEQQKLDRIVTLWEERVAWWNKEFDLSPPKYVEPAKSGALGGRGSGYGGGGLATSAAADGVEYEDDDRAMEESVAMPEPMESPASGARREFGADAASPAKKAKATGGGDAGPPPPSIALKPWDPQTPYLAALKAAPAAQWQSIYLRERDSWGTAPAYFLDCSDFFTQQNQPEVARRVLSNLVELELEDPALLRVFARRLAQIGELDLAITTFERIAELRPDEPQSHRDLALALADRADLRRDEDPNDAFADYQRALNLLAKVTMDEWERFAEIELIALVELNDILPRAQELGDIVVPVDSRLVEHLDMDVRIVMSWDADMTDMDLHVVEPSTEEAYYGHNRTRIGGRVSRDFTQGYGPEEYSIRRAMKGDYTIRTKFFGSSAAELQGAVTLTVDLYTNYGRPNQTHEAVTIRLAESKDTFTVAEISFQGGKPALSATRD
ncbi:MAG: DUF2135 domain-containing protein [Deltaproteobacteria bacterium]|nr:DUF2135 domain-containing protein [Deltaproteobacteria bacterium]